MIGQKFEFSHSQSVRPEFGINPQCGDFQGSSGDHFFQVGIKIQGKLWHFDKKVSFPKIFQNNYVEISKKWGFFLKMWGLFGEMWGFLG